jgi:hypothetical protein
VFLSVLLFFLTECKKGEINFQGQSLWANCGGLQEDQLFILMQAALYKIRSGERDQETT